MGDVFLSFEHHTLVASRFGHPFIHERLPSAFYMHPLLAARGQLNGQDVLLFLTNSRTSTRMCFVGLYRASGERLWTATIPSRDVLGCLYSPEEVVFLGQTQELHVTLSE